MDWNYPGGFMEEVMDRKNKIVVGMLAWTLLAILIIVVEMGTDLSLPVSYKTLGLPEIIGFVWLCVMIVLIVIREKVTIEDERKQPSRNHIDFK